MDINAIIYGLGSTGLFASRAFLPAFLTALFLRFGDRLPMIAHSPVFQNASGQPTWFTSGWTITVLGVLAVIEIAATKSPEAEEALEQIDKYLKTGMAVLSFLGVLSVTDQHFIEKTIDPAAQAGLFGTILALLVGATVFYLAALRNHFKELWIDADEDDDLGLRSLGNWGEDLWASFGVLLLVVYPVVMLVLLGIIAGLFALLRKYLEHREERSKTPCSSCGTPLYPTAMACQNCREPVTAPRAVGLFGQSLAETETDLDAHPLRLAAKKRCPVCAARLERKHPRQQCATCQTDLFADPAFVDRYVSLVTQRLPWVLGVTALLSLIPVLGLIPGIIVYRIHLVAPFRRYVPLGQRFCLKWILRLFFFILIAMQWIPVAGAVVVPIMALTSFISYRMAFLSLLETPPPEK